MVLFSTISSTERSLSRRDRSIEDPRSPQAAHVKHGAAGLSRSLRFLVSLTGIPAGYRVDRSSQRAAHPTAPSMHRSGLTAASPFEAFAAMPVDRAVPDGVARPADGVARPLRARRSQDVIIDHGRRK